MSFLKQAPQFGGGGNGASEGLGRLFGTDPSRISSIANSVGNVANGIAAAGGASAGYDGSAAPVNHLQMLDPAMLQTILQQFRGVDFRNSPFQRGSYQ